MELKEATTRFELVIRVLQTRALPLGHVAFLQYIIHINKATFIRQGLFENFHTLIDFSILYNHLQVQFFIQQYHIGFFAL